MGSTSILCVGNAVMDVHAEPGVKPPTAEVLAAARRGGGSGLTTLEHPNVDELLRPGGSAANTAAELARLGVAASFVGLAGDDGDGRLCRRGLEASGARWATPLAPGPRTSRVHLFVDGDGERSFHAELDACRGLGRRHVLAEAGRPWTAVLVEAYLLDGPSDAFDAAVELAHLIGATCAVTLGSATVAGRHRALLRELSVEGLVDLLVGNEEEFGALADGAEALSAMSDMRCVCVMTRGPRAPIATRGGTLTKGSAPTPTEVVDTAGAGDAFAAGLLSVLATGGPLEDALALGTLLGTAAVGRVGARAVTA